MEETMLKKKEETMLDFVIGNVVNVIDGNTFTVQITHIGRHNKFSYNDYEVVHIADRPVHPLNTLDGIQQKQQLFDEIGNRKIKCHVRYRDTYGRLYSDCELQ